jgi:branched-chain amino acid transport system permease protein
MSLNPKGTFRRDLVPIAIFAVVYLVVVLLVKNQYYQLMMTLVPIWAVMGLSWNVLSGYTGLVSFGHASFFGLGAYTVTLLLVHANITPWIGIPAATVIGAIAGLVIGVPTFRLRGHYFALAMLAYPLALLYVFEWLGYQEVALPMKREAPIAYMQFADQRIYSAIAVGLLVVVLVISRLVERSRFGKTLVAIKQNEMAAHAAGVDVLQWKLRAIMLSGAIAGAAGGLYAVILLVVTPNTVFGLLTSAQALIVTLFGGIGTMWGPLIGTIVLIPLSEVLHAELGHVIPGIQGVVFGFAIILVILLAPEGVYWKLRDLWLRSRSVPAASRTTKIADVVPMPARGGRHATTHQRKPILDVRGLCKSFGGIRAVEDVTFTVRDGEILGIIGPNGAGKTTLFNLLNGFYTADGGEALFQGRSVLGLSPNRICALGVGRTFQVVRSFPRFSVLENVVIGAFVATVDDSQAMTFARDALARVGLAGDADLPASGLTNKQLRLMELARALAGQPKMLLLDETLAGLGAQECEEILAMIRQLAEAGMTIVIIEHTMHAMVRLAERFVVLDHGAVLVEGKPEAVTRDPAVIEAYLGKKWSARA